MSGDESPRHGADDWDVYWRGTQQSKTALEGGADDTALENFWTRLFQQHLRAEQTQRMLDLACGNGAVTGFALQTAQLMACPEISVFCVDYSHSAVKELRKRYPCAHCVAADALSTPFNRQRFAIVASQFGLEYAGKNAVAEAARLVARGGVFAAILHLQDGVIYRECARNLQAIDAIRQCQLLDRARDAFAAGFALKAGQGSVAVFKSADIRFAPAVKALADIMRSMGQEVAGGLARQLYTDLAHMYRKMEAYAPDDVLNWIDRMVWELDAYAGRMASMMASAVDEAEMARLRQLIEARGLVISSLEKLQIGSRKEAGAWALTSVLAS